MGKIILETPNDYFNHTALFHEVCSRGGKKMSTFKQSIVQSMKGAVQTVETFPISIASAFAFAIVTMIRIQLDWPQQEAYNFLFNCLHLSFAVGAVFGLAAITVAKSRFYDMKSFITANILGVIVIIITFILLIFFGDSDSKLGETTIRYVSNIAASRISVVILISMLTFIFFAGYPRSESDFSKALFMVQKAFVIASIYGFVLMGGASGVAGAIHALLYRSMSGKVYMYLGTIIGFLAFAIFVGYFPEFQKGIHDPHREVAQKQPRFIEILFEYIMIPILLALTGVLLAWAGKTIITGDWAEFSTVSGIVISYSFGGIWLHLMVTHFTSGLTKFYRKVYPITAGVILLFGIWSFMIRLSEQGLQTEEYFFFLIWIFAMSSVVLLFFKKEGAHLYIITTICVLSFISVMPIIGYDTLPINFQVSRLEDLLIDEGILQDDELIPTTSELTLEVREAITESVDFLGSSEEAKLPDWFEENLDHREVFKEKLGFDQTWPDRPDRIDGDFSDTLGTYLSLPNGSIDISEYEWVAYFGNARYPDDVTTIQGRNGSYEISWLIESRENMPTIKILLDDQVILESDLKEYFKEVRETYDPEDGNVTSDHIIDMTYLIETKPVTVLLVFDNVDITVDPRRDEIRYWINLSAIYLKENN